MIKLLKNPFMIFAHARCGSTQLTKILNINDINTMYEPFSRGYHKGVYLKSFIENGMDDTLKLIMSLCQGFKHERDHLEFNQNVILLKKFPTIFIYRKNIVNTALSFLTAKQTKIWFPEQVKEQIDYAKNVIIDKENFLNYVQKIENMTKLYLAVESQSIQIAYEDLYGENGMDHLEKCFEFIKAKIIKTEETKKLLLPDKKLNRLPWEQVIFNWPEIEQTIFENNLQMPS